MKTPYSSFCLNSLPEGCRYCVKGLKLVLFISGKCKRNCYYCSLSSKRKNKDIIYANERIIKSQKQAIQEAIESNSNSAGITGGDPFLFMNRTIKLAKTLKHRFGKNFHIHIYLPTQNLTKNKLKLLSKYIDEVRFHPEFLLKKNSIKSDIDKIKIASLFWKKSEIGIELPVIPEKKQEILDFILQLNRFIGFVNLNELEISDTNFNFMTKKYEFNKTGYVIKNSFYAGLWILNKLRKRKTRLNVHFCTAELKNNHQFKNRLKKHRIFKLGKRTNEGTVLYLTTKYKNNKQLKNILNSLKKEKSSEFIIDRKKSRIILSNKLAYRLLLKKKHKIQLIEEFPTFDRIEVETKNF